MSQGLTWIAGRRIPLLALVALTALAVGLFAVMRIASAAPGVVVTINDSDNVIKAGAAKTINVAVLDDGAPVGSYMIEYVTVDNGLHVASVDLEAANASDAADTDDATLVVPANAEGEYTITAGVVDADGTPQRLSGSLTITVGDVGDAIGSVEVVLGTVEDTDANGVGQFITGATDDADKENAGPDGDSKPKEGVIAVTVSVLNTLGNKPNGDEISEILIFAPSAWVAEADANAEPTGAGIRIADNANSTSGTTSATATSFNFFVSDDAEGTIDVYAVVIGAAGGTATSAEVPLHFTGDADALTVSEANSPIAQKSGIGYVTVTATDKADNVADLNVTTGADNRDAVTASLKDADDTVVTSSKATIDIEQAPKAGKSFKVPVDTDEDDATTDATDCDGTNADPECDKNALRVTVTTTAAGLAAGEYTLAVVLGDDDPVTATIIVAGDAANVDVEVSSSTVSVGNIITLTATVTDEGGHVIPDGTTVEFNAVGALELTGLGGGAKEGVVISDLDNGVAMARYVVVRGSGTATIIATHGEGAKAIDGVTSVSTEAAAVVDEPDPEPVDGLSQTELNNFASWSGEGSVSASELLAGIAGASGVLFYDGDSWQRYGVVDGQVIPGSRDFTIRSGQTIWISG